MVKVIRGGGGRFLAIDPAVVTYPSTGFQIPPSSDFQDLIKIEKMFQSQKNLVEYCDFPFVLKKIGQCYAIVFFLAPFSLYFFSVFLSVSLLFS